jgi:hypothetical protein
MNEKPSSNPTPRQLCLSSIIYLNFAMAGDMESVDLLRQLLDRCMAIDWGSAQFASDYFQSIAHFQTEVIASQGETLSASMPIFRDAIKHCHGMGKTIGDYSTLVSGLLIYIKTMVLLHSQMKDQLEMLNADTSSYVLPPLPKNPLE